MAAESVVNGLGRSGNRITDRERADLRRYVATFASSRLLDDYTRSAVARLDNNVESLPVEAGSTGVDAATLARQVSEHFSPVVPEQDRWEIATDQEHDENGWNPEDLEVLADGTAHVLLKHQLPIDSESMALPAVLFDAVDLPRTRLRRLSRSGPPVSDDLDRQESEALSAALARGDGRRWAELLTTVRLYVPVAPTDKTWPADLPLPGDPGHLIAFTTAEGFEQVLGDSASGHLLRLASELQIDRPDGACLLVDPGLAGGVAIDLGELDELRAGRTDLVATTELRDRVLDNALLGLRRPVLDGLGIEEHAGTPAHAWLPDPQTLAELAHRKVAVLLNEAGTWRIFSNGADDDTRVVAAFSSLQILDTMLSRRPPHRWYTVSDLARAWPDGHTLHLDPGTPSEQILIDDMMRELPDIPDTAAKRENLLRAADELLRRAERTPEWRPQSDGRSHMVSDPAGIRRLEDEQRELGDRLAADTSVPPQRHAAPTPAERPGELPRWLNWDYRITLLPLVVVSLFSWAHAPAPIAYLCGPLALGTTAGRIRPSRATTAGRARICWPDIRSRPCGAGRDHRRSRFS